MRHVGAPGLFCYSHSHACQQWARRARQEAGMFPDTNTNWQAFFEVQKLILKNAGKVYAPGLADPHVPQPAGQLAGACLMAACAV